jgi:hypothetical protein
VAIHLPLSNRATFIGGGGGCTGAGGGTGIDGPGDCWNDSELQEEAAHASRIAIEATAAVVEVRERRRILGRGIDSSSGRMVEYRLSNAAAQQIAVPRVGLRAASEVDSGRQSKGPRPDPALAT